MRTAPFARGFFVGDYEGLDTQSGRFLALFSQTHRTDPASVFFTRITPDPAGAGAAIKALRPSGSYRSCTRRSP
jgi:hypothetical protein